jgi:hypothetical protein
MVSMESTLADSPPQQVSALKFRLFAGYAGMSGKLPCL